MRVTCSTPRARPANAHFDAESGASQPQDLIISWTPCKVLGTDVYPCFFFLGCVLVAEEEALSRFLFCTGVEQCPISSSVLTSLGNTLAATDSPKGMATSPASMVAMFRVASGVAKGRRRAKVGAKWSNLHYDCTSILIEQFLLFLLISNKSSFVAKDRNCSQFTRRHGPRECSNGGPSNPLRTEFHSFYTDPRTVIPNGNSALSGISAG